MGVGPDRRLRVSHFMTNDDESGCVMQNGIDDEKYGEACRGTLDISIDHFKENPSEKIA